ncbi:MAG: acyl-CoA thioesterase [Clostridiales bacterium]|jgi:acyl-CoA hydrolase|nr:acyl-CoA thioesterase [Clostridiales bacterium]
MRKYNSIHLVKGEDLNHHGTLFAARTAAWFVESAFAAAAAEHKNSSEILCRNIHGMSFAIPVEKGDVITFTSRVARAGRTSLTVHVSVRSELTGIEQVKGFITFVVVDNDTGRAKPHGIVLDEPDEEERKIRELANKLFEK